MESRGIVLPTPSFWYLSSIGSVGKKALDEKSLERKAWRRAGQML